MYKTTGYIYSVPIIDIVNRYFSLHVWFKAKENYPLFADNRILSALNWDWLSTI